MTDILIVSSDNNAVNTAWIKYDKFVDRHLSKFDVITWKQ